MFVQPKKKIVERTLDAEMDNHLDYTKHDPKGAFPSDASILKIFYLVLANISKKWTMPIRPWNAAIGQFAIIKPAGAFCLGIVLTLRLLSSRALSF